MLSAVSIMRPMIKLLAITIQIHTNPCRAVVLGLIPAKRSNAIMISNTPTSVKKRSGVSQDETKGNVNMGLSETSLRKSGWWLKALTLWAKNVPPKNILMKNKVFGLRSFRFIPYKA